MKNNRIFSSVLVGLVCLTLGAWPVKGGPNHPKGMQPFHAVITAMTSAVFDGCSVTNDEKGSGLAIHLGTFTWNSHEGGVLTPCPATSPTGNVPITGHFTLGAANGDDIQGEYHTNVSIDFATGEVFAYGRYEFTSGTGRFSNVSGGGVITANGSAITGEAAGTMDGVISYGGR